MVCVHTYSESYVAEIWPFEDFQDGAIRHLEFDSTGNGAIGSALPKMAP